MSTQIVLEMVEAAQQAVGSSLIDNDREYATAMEAAYHVANRHERVMRKLAEARAESARHHADEVYKAAVEVAESWRDHVCHPPRVECPGCDTLGKLAGCGWDIEQLLLNHLQAQHGIDDVTEDPTDA